MAGYTDTEKTLPSLSASLSRGAAAQELFLTVVFHPDVQRIGDWARLPAAAENSSWVVGRHSPEFVTSPDDSGVALEDPHVSRRALEMAWSGERLLVRKLPDASRSRLGGVELGESLEIEPALLKQGVSLQLGHAIVLLLRLSSGRQQTECIKATDGELLGRSRYMAGLRHQIGQVAATDLDVLILGETGTGKELVAGSIHRRSARKKAPLISVNMAAIPSGLAASMLFGSARGAFTGAEKTGKGYFLQAQGGTLFLDEIGDTPTEVQPQLLRALQQREIQPVGGPVSSVDLRIISATDANLEDAGAGFRAALRHRLGAAEIHLRPLREHPEDIGELFLHFLTQAAQDLDRVFLLPGRHSTEPELAQWAELFQVLLLAAWPGNVRELANQARQIILASEQRLTVPENLPLPDADWRDEKTSHRPASRRMVEVSGEEFERVLSAHRFEVAPAARAMGVSRQSVYRRMEETPGFRLANQVSEKELHGALRNNSENLADAALDLRVSLSGLRARLRSSKLYRT